MPLNKKTIFAFLFLASFLCVNFVAAAGFVPCATSENPKPCTLCHLIVGFWNLINYGLRIMVFVAVVGIVIAGVMYILSAGSEQMITTAKNFLKYILYGAGFVLAGWLLIFVFMNYFGVKGDLGIGQTSWYEFTCNMESTQGQLYPGAPTGNTNPNPNPTNPSACPFECCESNGGYATLGCPKDTGRPYCVKDGSIFKCVGCYPAGYQISNTYAARCCSGSVKQSGMALGNFVCNAGSPAANACPTMTDKECKDKGYTNYFCNKDGKCQQCYALGRNCDKNYPAQCCSEKCEAKGGYFGGLQTICK